MKNKVLRNGILIVICLILLVLCILGLADLLVVEQETDTYDKTLSGEEVQVTKAKKVKDPRFADWQALYEENHQESSYYVGQLIFDSGLINQPVVQASDNSYFLRRNWLSGKYDTLGTVFMDYECKTDSENVIIYGHNAFSYYDAGYDEDGNKLINDELMFTPLKFLIEKENYEANKIVYLVLEGEIREYEIAYVFKVNLTTDANGNQYPEEDMAYYSPQYDEEYFERYLDKIKDNEYYDTGETVTYGDQLLTLQTCIEGNDNAREIVLCKMVSDTFYVQ